MGLIATVAILTGIAGGADPHLPAIAPPQTHPLLDEGGYWVVSARDLEGGLSHGQRDCYQVFACNSSGRRCVSNLDALVQSLQPGVPVCFVMHGSFVDWETVWQDARETNAWLRSPCPGQPLHVVFFTWPSDDTSMLLIPVDVAILGRRSARYSFYLAEIISLIPDRHPVCLAGHSHGARMVVSTLHLLSGGQVEGISFAGGPFHRHRMRAVLFAGAFDRDWLNPGQKYDRAVHRPELIFNIQNRRDIALTFYPLHRPLAAGAAGRRGLRPRDRQRLGAAAEKIVEIDVTKDIRVGHIWPHYYRQPALACVIAPCVFFHDELPAEFAHAADLASAVSGRQSGVK